MPKNTTDVQQSNEFDWLEGLTRDEQTEELVDKADWLLDKEKEGE